LLPGLQEGRNERTNAMTTEFGLRKLAGWASLVSLSSIRLLLLASLLLASMQLSACAGVEGALPPAIIAPPDGAVYATQVTTAQSAVSAALRGMFDTQIFARGGSYAFIRPLSGGWQIVGVGEKFATGPADFWRQLRYGGNWISWRTMDDLSACMKSNGWQQVTVGSIAADLVAQFWALANSGVWWVGVNGVFPVTPNALTPPDWMAIEVDG
jgi:hypothetical protein